MHKRRRASRVGPTDIRAMRAGLGERMDQKTDYAHLQGKGIGQRDTNRAILLFTGTGFFNHNGVQEPDFPRIMEAAQDFIDTFPGLAMRFMDHDRGVIQKIKGTNWCDRSGLLSGDDTTPDKFAFAVFSEGKRPVVRLRGFLPIGERGGRRNSPGVIELGVPLDWIAEDPDRCVAKVAQWCALLRPEQGTVGIETVASFHTSQRNYGVEYWPWLARYSGLDAQTRLKYDRRDPHQALRTVNWLTVLDDVWVGKLGGVETIAAALHPEGSVHPYDGGVVIRACTHPQLGDLKTSGVPEAYVMVDRLIRPFRFNGYAASPPMHRLKVPEALDPAEATEAWVRRFEHRDPEKGTP